MVSPNWFHLEAVFVTDFTKDDYKFVTRLERSTSFTWHASISKSSWESSLEFDRSVPMVFPRQIGLLAELVDASEIDRFIRWTNRLANSEYPEEIQWSSLVKGPEEEPWWGRQKKKL